VRGVTTLRSPSSLQQKGLGFSQAAYFLQRKGLGFRIDAQFP
jgi:hypothetical protein